MPHPTIIAEAWMSAMTFAERQAAANSPYPTLVQKHNDEAIAYEIQAMLVTEMVKGRPSYPEKKTVA